MKTYIYALKDPITEEIRYIGKSDNPEIRLKNHIYKCKQSKKHSAQWIQSLINKELKPILEILEECNKDIWEEREIYWISKYNNLTNHTTGGEGRNHDGKSTIKIQNELNIDILLPQAISMIPEYSDRDIERKLGFSKGFLSRCRNGYIEYTKQNNIIIPENKTKGNNGTNKGKKLLITKRRINTGKGYSFITATNKYRVYHYINNERKIFGNFETQQEAIDTVNIIRNLDK